MLRLNLQRSTLKSPSAHFVWLAYAYAKGCTTVTAFEVPTHRPFQTHRQLLVQRYSAVALCALSAKTFCVTRRQLRFSPLSLDGLMTKDVLNCPPMQKQLKFHADIPLNRHSIMPIYQYTKGSITIIHWNGDR
jgi:hypothetical protein